MSKPIVKVETLSDTVAKWNGEREIKITMPNGLVLKEKDVLYETTDASAMMRILKCLELADIIKLQS